MKSIFMLADMLADIGRRCLVSTFIIIGLYIFISPKGEVADISPKSFISPPLLAQTSANVCHRLADDFASFDDSPSDFASAGVW